MPRSVFTDSYKIFVEVLIAARKKANVTQVELSQRLGKPQQFISRFENAQRRIDAVEFIAIARALKVDPQDLFGQVLKKLPKSIEI